MVTSEIADYSGLHGTPSDYFSPTSVAQLKDFLKNNPLKVIRIGGGLTGVSGGAVPLSHECFLDLSKLTAIEWYDEDAGIIQCEAGVTMHDLLQFAQSKGWDFPVIPGSLTHATIGGMVACNGGGPRSLKYGKIGNYMLALDILTPTGETIQVGGKATKISQGISDKSIWIGSEGTLGIITSLLIRCTPQVPPLHFKRIACHSLTELMHVIPSLLKLDPSILELASKDALKFTSNVNEHVIWVGFTNPTEILLPASFNITDETPDILEERFNIGHKLQGYKPFIDLDVSFPIKHSTSAVNALSQLLDEHELEHIVFGHAGDGNYHIHVFFDDNRMVWENIQQEFDKIITSHEGFISGEHGIGRIHSERYKRTVSDWNKNIYTALKSCLDPNNQLPSLI